MRHQCTVKHKKLFDFVHRENRFCYIVFHARNWLSDSTQNPFEFLLKSIEINGEEFWYYDLSYFKQLPRLPYSIRVLLESAVRNCDNFHVKESDVTTILNWAEYKGEGVVDEKEYEIPFKPARVILQDFTGVKY